MPGEKARYGRVKRRACSALSPWFIPTRTLWSKLISMYMCGEFRMGKMVCISGELHKRWNLLTPHSADHPLLLRLPSPCPSRTSCSSTASQFPPSTKKIDLKAIKLYLFNCFFLLHLILLTFFNSLSYMYYFSPLSTLFTFSFVLSFFSSLTFTYSLFFLIFFFYFLQNS